MVGLLKKSHRSSTENKMGDSNEKGDVIDDNAKKSKSNGNEIEEKPDEEKEEQANEEAMDVDEDKSETEDFEVADEVDPRKGRSSRSHSSNSAASSEKNKINSEEDKKSEASEDEEGFRGFDSPKSSTADVQETILQLKQRIGEVIADTPLNAETDSAEVANSDRNDSDDDQSTEKASVSDVMESGLDNSNVDNAFADNDSNQGATPSSSRKSVRGNKKSVSVDLSNPEFRKPFEFGWVRELVYRSTSDSSVRRNADIYYYTPSGKKVRSSREILEHLTGDLTIDNFSFFKEPIGLDDPTKEIIREAKAKPGPRGYEEITPVKKIATPKAKTSVTSSSTPKPSPKESTKNTSTPKVFFRSFAAASTGGNRLSKSKLDKKRKSAGPDDADIYSDGPEWKSEQKNDPARDVCSIECPLAMGIIPTLQCIVCLCLYHPECCGFQPDKMKKNQFEKYICKNCQALKISQPASSHPLPPPPVPPLPQRSTKTVVTTSQSNISTNTSSSVSISSSTKPRSGGIVGAVTSWIAPSSSIKVSSEEASNSKPSPPIQGLVTIAGKEYVIVPRSGVVNVQEPSQESQTASSAGLVLVPCFPQPPLTNGPASYTHSSSVPLTNGLKRPCESPVPDSSTPPEKKIKRDKINDTEDRLQTKPHDFMNNLHASFFALVHAFQYLKVYELLRASRVSKLWNAISTHNILWETVRMKNSKVSNWKGFAKALQRRGTRYLDLRKMLTPDTPEQQVEMWEELCEVIRDVSTIVKVDMGRCSPAAFEAMAKAAPQLESLVSLSIKGNEIDLKPIAMCVDLTELKLKAVSGGIEIKNLFCIREFPHLQHLALTTIKNLQGIEKYLPEGLITLELGECSQLTEEFATDKLPRLVNLKRLRLEKGQNDCPTISLLESISKLPELTQLELINFDIKPGFEKTINKCTNLITLLIIPTYVTQSATTNHVVMGGVAKLSATLKYFIWGLTLELLKVTDLFIGQVENQKTGTSGKPGTPKEKKSGSGDSIPILKPCGDNELREGSQAPSQVDILALPNLQRVLSTLLPTTKIKILKVPFSATWRQTVTDAP